MAQFGRPASDITVSDWTTAPLFDKIDETVGSDTDFIASNNSTNNASEVGLTTALGDPLLSTGHVIRYRYAKSAAAGNARDLTVGLYQGTTLIAGQTHSGISEVWTAGSLTLSGAEADAITNYTDLRLRFTPGGTIGGAGGNRRSVQVSWAEFEAPDAATIYTVSPPVAAVTAAGNVPVVQAMTTVAVAAATGDGIALMIQIGSGIFVNVPVATAIAGGHLPPVPVLSRFGLARFIEDRFAVTTEQAALPVPWSVSSQNAARFSIARFAASRFATGGGIAAAPTEIIAVSVATAAAASMVPTTQGTAIPPAATATAAAFAVAISQRVSVATAFGVATGLALTPRISAMFPVAEAPAQGLAVDVVAVERIQTVDVPEASAAATALAVGMADTVAAPVATATGAGLAPTLRDRIAAPVATASGAGLAPNVTSAAFIISVPVATAAGAGIAPSVRDVAAVLVAAASGAGITATLRLLITIPVAAADTAGLTVTVSSSSGEPVPSGFPLTGTAVIWSLNGRSTTASLQGRTPETVLQGRD